MSDASRDRGSWVRWQERNCYGACYVRMVRQDIENTAIQGCACAGRRQIDTAAAYRTESLETLNGAIITTVFDVDDTALSTVEVGDHG